VSLSALSPEERTKLITSVGTHRGERPLSPMEVARLLHRVIESGATRFECAKAVGLEPTQVGRFLSLLELPPDVQDLVDWGRTGATLAFSAGFELSRLPTAAEQREAVMATIKHKLTTSEARQLVQARTRSGKSINESVATTMKMRPQVEVRHVFLGSIVATELKKRLAQLSQQQRDALLKRALSSDLAELSSGGRLGATSFTIAGSTALGNAINAGSDKLEARVNAAIKGEISR
jgi:hypothetical protein